MECSEGKDFLGKRQQTCHLDRLTFMSLENANESNFEKTIGLFANKEKKERDNDILGLGCIRRYENSGVDLNRSLSTFLEVWGKNV